MKKIISVAILMFVIVAAMFVSCKDGKVADTTAETTKKTETTAEETTVDETTAEDTTKAETTKAETTTKAPATTTKAAVTTKAPETTAASQQGNNQQSQSGGGDIGGGDVSVVTGGTETKAPATTSNSSGNKPSGNSSGNNSSGNKKPSGGSSDTAYENVETYAPKDDGSLDGNVACPQAASTKDAFGGAQLIRTKGGKSLTHTYSDRAVISEDNSTNLPYMPMVSTTVLPDPNGDYNNPRCLLNQVKPGFSTDGVLVGYDGYMFYQDTINDFIGEGFLHDQIYNRAVNLLTSYNDFAKKHGMKFYFVIAPNKNSVYPDYMPEGYTMAQYRRYDQFIEIVKKSGITAVDLRGAMSAAAKKYPARNLYYKYDTHWNNHAGYVAYETTMNLVRKDFPNAILHGTNEYQINYCETYMKDQAYYLGYYSYYKDYGPVYTLKTGKTAKLANFTPKDVWGQFRFAYECTSGDNKGYSDKLYYYKYKNEYNTSAPNAYILRDSYSIAMAPFLKDSFNESTYNWTFNFESVQSDILASKANVIIMIVAERNLRNMVNCKVVTD